MTDTLITDAQIDAIWAKETLDITVHCRFARAVLAAAVPPGHKVVPVEPTPDMIRAVQKEQEVLQMMSHGGIYRAMLAAAPERTP